MKISAEEFKVYDLMRRTPVCMTVREIAAKTGINNARTVFHCLERLREMDVVEDLKVGDIYKFELSSQAVRMIYLIELQKEED